MENLRMDPDFAERDVNVGFSGGEKKRLFLLKLLIEKPNVLLLDEPTNDLDIATLTVLENFLQNFGGPVITVSHDRYFLDKVASKILAFEMGGHS